MTSHAAVVGLLSLAWSAGTAADPHPHVVDPVPLVRRLPGDQDELPGVLLQPRVRQVVQLHRLAGRELHRWFDRGNSPAEDPWLPDHYAAMGLDGTIYPVDIKTRWNIRYRPR